MGRDLDPAITEEVMGVQPSPGALRLLQALPVRPILPTTLSLHSGRLAGGLGLLVYVAWCLSFIWDTSFVIDGRRFFCLFEDGMISLTYARNLMEGHGLTWARWGDPVEGFTPPLWTLGMSVSQLPVIPLSLRPLLVQLATMTILVIHVVVVFRLTRRHLTPRIPSLAWVAAFATAAYFPLNFWALLGMETGLQALLLTLAVYMALEVVHAGKDRVIALCSIIAAAVLLRPDMVVGCSLILAYTVVFGRSTPFRWAQWLRGALIFIVVVGAYETFRILYFGDVLPNTYWLKMTGGDAVVRIMRGFSVFTDTALSMPMVLIVGLVAGLLTSMRRRPHLLLLAIVSGYLSYSIYVGGDQYELDMSGSRFVCFSMPLLAILVVGIADSAAERWPRFGSLRSWQIGLGVGLFLFVSMNGLLFGPNVATRRGYVMGDLPQNFEVQGRVLADTLRLNDQFPADTKVAVIWAGIPAYFSDFKMIDTLGYNDREIAVGPWAFEVSRDDPRSYVPGHMKQDLDYTLSKYEPDVFFQCAKQWTSRLEEAGYQRYSTGPVQRWSTGEIWVRPPLTLDTSPWDK